MVSKKIIEKIIDKTVTKTHDGTSLGRLKESFKKFNRKYGGLDHEEATIFDGNGKELYHTKGNDHHVTIDDGIVHDLDSSNGLYIMHNHPVCYNNVPVILSFNDVDKLRTFSVFDNEFAYNSISATAENGSTMTVIRNNKFNKGNEFDYMDATILLDESQDEYLTQYKEKVLKYMDEKGMSYQQEDEMYYIEKVDQPQFQQEAENNAIKEMGSFEEYLKKKGVYSAFEKANTKLRIDWWNR